MLCQLCAARRPQDRSGFHPVQDQIDSRLVSPAARLQRRQGTSGDRHPRHGQLQRGQCGAGERPLDAARRRGFVDRRTGAIRKSAARRLRLDQNWIDAGPAVVDWLLRRPEIDGQKIGVSGASFGSFFGTILTANEPRIAATAVISTCLEPGCHTIFEEASPTFKKRFMWMSNYTDEAKFNEFVKTLTWEGHVERIRSPYLVVAGEADELSPLEHTERMIRTMTGPRQLVVYADSRHSVGNVPAANLGPFPPALVADWLVARLRGKPVGSERWLVEATGRIVKTAL